MIFKLRNLIGWKTGDWPKSCESVFIVSSPLPFLLRDGKQISQKLLPSQWGWGRLHFRASICLGDQQFFLNIFVFVNLWSSVKSVPNHKSSLVFKNSDQNSINGMNLWKICRWKWYVFDTVFHFYYVKTVWDK